jgi:hypothetical protein
MMTAPFFLTLFHSFFLTLFHRSCLLFMDKILCSYCPHRFGKTYIAKHLKKHLPTGDFPLPCSSCGYRFDEVAHHLSHQSQCRLPTTSRECIEPSVSLKRSCPIEDDCEQSETVQDSTDFVSIGGEKFFLGGLTLNEETIDSLYQQAGISRGDADPDLDLEGEGEEPEASDLFPNKETFLSYLLFQQEGAHRISERNMNLFLQLLTDSSLERANFPKSTRNLKKIDQLLREKTQDDVFTMEVHENFQKNSKRKKTALPGEQSASKVVKVKGFTIASRLKAALNDPIVASSSYFFEWFYSV